MPRYAVVTDFSALNYGDEVTVWNLNERGNRTTGQGGVVTGYGPEHCITIDNRRGDRFHYTLTDLHEVVIEEPYDLSECIEHDESVCHGAVEPFSPRGFGGPLRCEYHVARRIERYQSSLERYADSDCPPAWFDPTYAGESW